MVTVAHCTQCTDCSTGKPGKSIMTWLSAQLLCSRSQVLSCCQSLNHIFKFARQMALALLGQSASAVLIVYICLYILPDIDEICVCSYLFISDFQCLYNGMFISGYKHLYLDTNIYIRLYLRHISKDNIHRYKKTWKFRLIYLNYI